MWLWKISMWWAHVESWHTLGLWLLLFSHKNSQETPQGLWTWDLTRDVVIWMKMVWNVHLLSTPGIISTSIYKAVQSYDPKSSKSWPWLSNVVLKPAVEGCEILHHQKIPGLFSIYQLQDFATIWGFSNSIKAAIPGTRFRWDRWDESD